MNLQAYASISLFVGLFLLISFSKPSFLFLPDGSIREFGIGKQKSTIIPIWFIVLILAFLSYLSVHVILAYYPIERYF